MNPLLYGPWGRVLVGVAAGVLALLVGLGAVIATENVTLAPRATADPYAQVPVVLPTQAPSPTATEPVLSPLLSTASLPTAQDLAAAEATSTPTPTPEPAVAEATSTPTPTPEPAVAEATSTPTPEPTATSLPVESPTSSAPAPTPTLLSEAGQQPPDEAAGALPGQVISPAGSNLREGPGLDRPVVAVLPGETRILALGRTEDGGWVRVLVPDLAQIGWLRIDQVTLEGDVMALPVVAE